MQSDRRETLRDAERQLVAGGELPHPLLTIAAIANAHELVPVGQHRGLQAGDVHTHCRHRTVRGESLSREVPHRRWPARPCRERSGYRGPTCHKRIDDLARGIKSTGEARTAKLPNGCGSPVSSRRNRGASVRCPLRTMARNALSRCRPIAAPVAAPRADSAGTCVLVVIQLLPNRRIARDCSRIPDEILRLFSGAGCRKPRHEFSNLANLAARGDELELRRTDRTGATLERRGQCRG